MPSKRRRTSRAAERGPRREHRDATAKVPSRGVSVVVWLVLIVIALLAVAYFGGVFA